MPLYEYNESGRVVQRVLPVADRDKYPGRITIPRTLHVCPRGAPSQGDEVLRGWYRSEERMGTDACRRVEKALGLTADKVKKVWREER